ncbi:MAG: hypothetical protein CL853_09665 [Crocinitomicaceae bacterium]|nr:hypothetical protein [Crocinitomicaceae bacterium]
MKKVILIGLTLCSCVTKKQMYFSENIKKNLSNISTMERWIEQDYLKGNLTFDQATDYNFLLGNMRYYMSLKAKKIEARCKKKNKYADDKTE